MALTLDDFSTTHVSFDPKSMSIGAISRDLGFGEEYMVFMDDNIFELAEVFTRHPGIDLILAGPEPETTLKKLTESRLFNTVSIVKEDLERCNNSKILKKQRELKSSLKNIDEFLQAINISLTFSRLNEKNKNRAVQLIQKSNQFNLTTRRHGEDDLIRFGKEVGEVIVVAYDDTFGSQGIISIVILVPSGEKICIESWVMSCRVLNRTVEQAIFSYIQKLSNGRTISGEYIPTEKNKLVKSLYESLSFQLVSKDESTGAELWDFPAQITTPSHFVTIKEI